MKAQFPVKGTGFQFREQFSQEPILLRKLISSTNKGHYNLLDSYEVMAREHFVMIQQ